MSKLNHFQTRPKVPPIPVAAYLDRLGLKKELPSMGYLRQLHLLHVKTFPIENLDMHFKIPVTTEIRPIYTKMLRQESRRGGIGHELNLMFYHLLIHLGYDAMIVSARKIPDETTGHEYGHLVSLVQIQNDVYLCDVGWPFGPLYPKRLEEYSWQIDHNRFFRFEIDPDDWHFLQLSPNMKEPTNQYRFEIKSREPIEFIDRINFLQQNPSSPELKQKIIHKVTDEGRIHLTNKLLMIQSKGETKEWLVLNEDDFYTKMEEHFGISLQSLLQG